MQCIHISLSLSIPPSVYLFSTSRYLSIYLSFTVSLTLYLSLSIYLCIVFTSLYLFLYISPSFYPSLYLYTSLSLTAILLSSIIHPIPSTSHYLYPSQPFQRVPIPSSSRSHPASARPFPSPHGPLRHLIGTLEAIVTLHGHLVSILNQAEGWRRASRSGVNVK